jgi:hypothetical protein
MATKFTLEGVTRLNGSPVASDVFVYESVTGALRTKIQSSAGSGSYKIEDVSGEIMTAGEKYFLLCNYGAGVRPLAHGPVTPLAENVSTDPYWPNVVLLLNMDGGDQSTQFIDRKGRAVTPYGGAKQVIAQKKFGVSSGIFGSTTGLSVAGLSLGTSDFTIEAWFYRDTLGTTQFCLDTRNADLTNTGFSFYVRSSNHITFGSGNPFTATEGTISLSDNQWHHVALTRSSGTVRGFVNGQLDFTTTSTSNFSNTTWSIGHSYSPPVSEGTKYLDEVRITAGVARYTENFTPPDAPFPQL